MAKRCLFNSAYPLILKTYDRRGAIREFANEGAPVYTLVAVPPGPAGYTVTSKGNVYDATAANYIAANYGTPWYTQSAAVDFFDFFTLTDYEYNDVIGGTPADIRLIEDFTDDTFDQFIGNAPAASGTPPTTADWKTLSAKITFSRVRTKLVFTVTGAASVNIAFEDPTLTSTRVSAPYISDASPTAFTNTLNASPNVYPKMAQVTNGTTQTFDYTFLPEGFGSIWVISNTAATSAINVLAY